MSSHLKAELAATCSTLGRLHKGEYLIEPDCVESVKDLIRYLKRDNEAHEIRRYLGESKVLQNDLVHIIKSCSEDDSDLFDVTLRLLINLTTPTMLFYGEEIPAEKIGRNIYLSLVGYSQEYKIAFCDVEFWNKVCGKLTDLFETDWSERSADDGIQIERILMLLRNVLQVPADVESEKRPENDISVHDRVLWALRQSQILELLLFISANTNEEQYYLNLLEIFSLILREQNSKNLAHCEIQSSSIERNKDTQDLIVVREQEKKNRNKYINMRNFSTTFVMKGMKSLSDNDIVCHKPLDKVNKIELNNFNKKQVKAPRNRIPVESERAERRSTFSVRLFLKEFCLEFVNSSFRHLMHVVKNKLDSGKSLVNDQSYYFWALNFFLDFATTSNSDIELVKDFLSSECFHFVQTSIDSAFEHLMAEKKKTVDWVKRIHLILKAYRSLLETLLWMDCSKNPLTRSISREIKSQIFYVVEYREMTLHILLLYDPKKFSLSYLRDLIETTHLFVKLLEEYSKQTKLVVQKIQKKKSTLKKNKKMEQNVETREEKWKKIRDDTYDILCSESTFPEIPPFDAALEIPIDDQKGRAMKNIQKLLHEGKIKEGIGLLRSARQVWPENDHFGVDGMSVEDETMALQEICLADLGHIDGKDDEKNSTHNEEVGDEEENDNLDNESRIAIVEQDFDIMDYKKRFVNRKVVEACGILLKNYKNNSDHTNHCVIKLLHRIGWECCMPGMLFQASIFWTLLKVMRDNSRNYDEINTFTVNLIRKFRKHATKNSVIFLELLFWKENNVALEIQHGYEPYKGKQVVGKRERKNKLDRNTEKKTRKKKENRQNMTEYFEEKDEDLEVDALSKTEEHEMKENEEGIKIMKRRRKKIQEEEVIENCQSISSVDLSLDEDDTVSSGLKGPGNVCRVLFDNNSQSDDIKYINENDSRKCTVSDIEDFDGDKDFPNLLEIDTKLSKSSDNFFKSLQKTVKKGKMRVFKNSKDKNEQRKDNHFDEVPSGNIQTLNNQFQDEQHLINGNVDEEENGNETSGKKFKKKRNKGNIRCENHCLESRSQQSKLECNNEHAKDAKKDRKRANIGIDEADMDNLNQREDSNCSSNIQTSPKEDAWEVKKKYSFENPKQIEEMNSKRVRCIGSDSEVENVELEDEESVFIPKRKRRRRLAIIDSDSDLANSDMESNSLQEK